MRISRVACMSCFASLRCAAWRPAALRRARSARTSSAAAPRSSRLASTAADADDGEAPEAPGVKQRILSGVQPTGALHLGNYLGESPRTPRKLRRRARRGGLPRYISRRFLGAIRQWVLNQDKYDNYFCVVDLHAITLPHDPKILERDTLSSAALYLAAGIDPDKSKIFVQSHVTAHAELCWLLNCNTPMNWLERMIQYKEKARKQGENVGVGLFDYPVLMAADILLYQAGLVPVGEDQRQHLELTRDIARRFNDQYCKKKSMPAKGKRVFREPQALIVKEGARIMSLTDGTAKMSKSAESDFSRINLTDPPDVIAAKIKKCKTDLMTGLEFDNPDRPECTNLLNIYQAVQPGATRESVLADVEGLSWGSFKPKLAEAVIAHVGPIQQRYDAVMADPAYIRGILADGADAADAVAHETLRQTKAALGMAPRPYR
ncbi:hypothetical protein M885DRAFT_613188 [Pelagophyceae sp. CCMP2097]|nr:hypothetical protein M885DRAFT_613188 [Pelagophyceae sp. CCMP2097]